MKKRAGSSVILLWLCGAPSLFALDAAERLQFADGLYSRGIHDMALQEYQQFLQDFPDSPQADAAYYRIGECQSRLGNKAAAERAYGRVVADYPKSAHRFRAGFRQAELLKEAQKPDEALALMNRLLQENPPAESAGAFLYVIGDIQMGRGKESEAVSAFEKMVSQYPASEFASYGMLSLGGIYSRREDKGDAAADLFARVAAKPATDRVGAEAWFQLAELCFRRGQFEKSARAYEKLLTGYPSDRRAAEARLQAAWAFHNAGLYADGLRWCEQSLAASTNMPADEQADWLYAKANCLRHLMKHEEAVRTYTLLMEKCPDARVSASAAYERALTYYRMGKYAEAVKEAKDLAAAPETKKDIYWLLAESYAAMNEDNDAVQYYRLLSEQFPNDTVAAAARYRMAHLLQKRGDFAQAAALFEAVATAYPDGELAPQALHAAAFCFTKLKKHDSAVRDWAQLAQKYPQSPLLEESLYQKGQAEIHLRRDAAARESLQELLRRFPNTRFAPDAQYWLGILFQDAGAFADAEKEFRAAGQGAPPEDLRRRIQFRLALVLQKQGKLEEAATILQSLLPTPMRRELTPELLEWLAGYRLQKQDFAAALEAALAVTESSEDPAWKQIGWSLVGNAHFGLSRHPEAEDAFRKALAAKAGTSFGAEAALRLGEIALAKGNHNESDAFFQEAARRAADDSTLGIRVQSYAGLARSAKARRKFDDAARYFMSVAVLFDDPDLVPECLYEAAEAFRTLGRAEDRDKVLKELAQRYPQSKWAKLAENSANEPK